MRLLLDVSIDQINNIDEDAVVRNVTKFLEKEYGASNVDVDVNSDTEYDEEEIDEPDDEKE